jgi:hypothetical protein
MYLMPDYIRPKHVTSVDKTFNFFFFFFVVDGSVCVNFKNFPIFRLQPTLTTSPEGIIVF